MTRESVSSHVIKNLHAAFATFSTFAPFAKTRPSYYCLVYGHGLTLITKTKNKKKIKKERDVQEPPLSQVPTSHAAFAPFSLFIYKS